MIFRKTLIIVLLSAFNFCAWSQSTLDAIALEGLSRTSERYVRKLIDLQPGDDLDSLCLFNEWRFLSYRPIFTQVDYNVSEVNDSTILTYTFDEAFTILPDVNFWTINDQFAFKLGVSEFNLFGRGIQLNASYQNNGLDSYFTYLKIPRIIGGLGIAAGGQIWNSRETVYAEGEPNFYVYSNESIEALLFLNSGYNHTFEFGGSLFREGYNRDETVMFDSSLPDVAVLNKYAIKLNYFYNQIEQNYFYFNGWSFKTQLQTVITEGISERFLIMVNDLNYYNHISEKTNVAARLRMGISSNSNSPFSPFSLDNNINIRGVGNQIERGTGVVSLNLEYRYSAIDWKSVALQTVAFADFGGWRTPGGNLDDFSNPDLIRTHVGGGLRFIYKQAYNTIFRIDYGVGLDRTKSHGLVIGLGQYF